MMKLKISDCEASILLFHKNSEVGVNFTVFCEVEPLKLRYLTDYF
jgi:hypothetical protein